MIQSFLSLMKTRCLGHESDGAEDLLKKGPEVFHGAILNGARRVISHREILNEINVFPVRDGDTGNNLTSMMRSITRESKAGASLETTLASVSEVALRGARGNSGIIFAQYFCGLHHALRGATAFSFPTFAQACQQAADYAYRAIEQPVEGTIITVMRAWGDRLMATNMTQNNDAAASMSTAFKFLEDALTATQYQLKDLRKAGVVDSGAKGFVLFIKGMLDYFETGVLDNQLPDSTHESLPHDERIGHELEKDLSFRYCTEAFLDGSSMDLQRIRGKLSTLGDSLVIAGDDSQCRVHIHTDHPSTVVEALHGEGNIAYQKVDDMRLQQNVISSQKSKIAIVTDSIADIPIEFLDEHQIHVIYLNILFKNTSFIDKLTIKPSTLLEYSRDAKERPTSSLPDSKHIESILEFICAHYEKIMILTVSSSLSGTHNSIHTTAQRFSKQYHKPIVVIDTRLNSGAQGLIVKKAAELVAADLPFQAIEAVVRRTIDNTQILVAVRDVGHMIKSGRLSHRMGIGKLAERLRLNPIITLDAQGRGKLCDVGFSENGCLKRLISHIKKHMKSHEIESYSIVHVMNPEVAAQLEQACKNLIGKPPAYVVETSSIVAAGAGEGAVAISFSCKL